MKKRVRHSEMRILGKGLYHCVFLFGRILGVRSTKQSVESVTGCIRHLLCILALGVAIWWECGSLVCAYSDKSAMDITTRKVVSEEAIEFWGKQLNTEERLLYDKMLSGCKNGIREKIVVTYEKNDLWKDGEEGIEAYVSNLVARAYSAFTYDYPLYRPSTYTYQYQAEGLELTISLSFTEFYDDFLKDLDEVQGEIAFIEDGILAEYEKRMGNVESENYEEQAGSEEQGISNEQTGSEEQDGSNNQESLSVQDTLNGTNYGKKEMEINLLSSTDLEKYMLVELIYQAVIEEITYSFQTDSVSDMQADIDPVVFSVSAAVMDKWKHHSVCSGYSGLFQILCNDLGIPCIQVCNSGTNERDAHSYNYVLFSDGWYMIDCTWGDEDGMINWDSFLCGNKVSLDGRNVGYQLANQYVVNEFLNPELVDVFYYQLDSAIVSDTTVDKVVYDLCADSTIDVNAVEITISPYLDSVQNKMTIEDIDEDLIRVSNRYWDGVLEKEFDTVIYPQYVYENNLLHITGLQDMMRLKYVPEIIAMEYSFDYVGSDVMFMLAQDDYEKISTEYEMFSMLCETNSENINSNITDAFRKAEEGRKQSDRLFGITFSNWSDFYLDGNVSAKIPLEQGGYVGSNLLYAYGISFDGEVVELGSMEIIRDVTANQCYVQVPVQCKTILFYQKEWKENTSNRMILITIIVIFIVLAFASMILYKYRKA